MLHLRDRTRPAIALTLLLASAAATSAAQDAPRTNADSLESVTPGARYRAGAFTRAIAGTGWRDLWTTPVAAPVLDPDTHLGGLELVKRGGGFHSLVLHLQEAGGWREYRFRSVDKFPMQGTPQLRGTVAGRVIEGQVASLFPAAPLLVPPLLDALGILHVKPELYVMGDSPRLEHVRDTVVGMLGTFELAAQEAPDDTPGFGGSSKIKGTEKFLDDLLENRGHRLDERELLAARLIDILVNDPDRSPDNYNWARFGEKGAYTWRPLPRDRDQAFIDARGLLNAVVIRRIYPKQIPFRNKIPLRGLTYSAHVIDRRLLQRLTADDFREVALHVQRTIDDRVIDQVVAQLPREWRERTTEDDRIGSVLRARRDQLREVAMAFYRSLAAEVDIRGTNEPDRIEVVRHADGRVTVTVTDPLPGLVAAVRRADGTVETESGGAVARTTERGPFFTRTFHPGETKELRIYALDGDDHAVVRGQSTGAITVRVIGGAGDDALADSAGGARTALYDAEGSNRLVAARGTRVNTRPWKELRVEPGFRFGGDWKPDWGGSRGWRPVVDYSTGAGVIVGGGLRTKKYGFRRLPYHWAAGATLMVGTGNGRLGLEADLDYRAENVPRGFRIEGTATQLDDTRFFGYGNDTPRLARELNLVHQNVVTIEASSVRYLGWRAREGEGNAYRAEDTTRYAALRPIAGELRVGPTFAWIDPDPAPGSPLARTGVAGGSSFALAGAQLALELDRTDDDAVPTTGWTLDAGVAAYPALLGLDDAFGTASARASMYVPLGRRGGPHLAFRGGGAFAAGDQPVQFAPAIGGRRTVRGYSYRRFAGDAAADASAELRVPVGTVNVLVRSQLGVFALADAGRVWFDGRSDGGVHTGVGGGLWLAAFGRSVSLAYVRGEGSRLYLSSGLFY